MKEYRAEPGSERNCRWSDEHLSRRRCIEDRNRSHDVLHVKDRLQVAICEPVEVGDDGEIFGRQRINNTEPIFVMNIAIVSIHASRACIVIWLEPSLG